MAAKTSGATSKADESANRDRHTVKFIYSFDRRQLSNPKASDADARAKPERSSKAIDELFDGNRRFARFISHCKGKGDHRPVRVKLVPREVGVIPPGDDFPPQLPFAAVLGCVDARAPVELLFAKGFDDLYIMRIAGNTQGPDCLASLRYAIHSFAALEPKSRPNANANANAKPGPKPPFCPGGPAHRDKPLRLVVALGHSDCGAVTAAVDTFLGCNDISRDESDFLVDDSVRGLLGRVHLPAVNLAAKALPPESFGPVGEGQNARLYRKALIELSVYVNAAWSGREMKAIVDEYEYASGKSIEVRYGVFDPRDCFVRAVDGYRFVKPGSPRLKPPAKAEQALNPPPDDLGQLFELAQKLADVFRRHHQGKEGGKALGTFFMME